MPVSRNNRRKKSKKSTKPAAQKPTKSEAFFDDEVEIAPNVFAFGDFPDLEMLQQLSTFTNQEAFELLNSHAVYVEKEYDYTNEDIAVVVGMLVLNDETEVIVKTPNDGLLQVRKSTFYKNFALIDMDF